MEYAFQKLQMKVCMIIKINVAHSARDGERNQTRPFTNEA